MKELSLAAPAYNEAETLYGIVENWIAYLKEFPGLSDFEIVIVNDGSRDDTGTVLDALAASYPQVRPIHFQENRGATVALGTAIANTTKEWVLLIDSDGQFPIENLRALHLAVESQNAEVAHGVRLQKKDSYFARFGSMVSGSLTNLVFSSHYRDFNCACKLIEGSLARSLQLEAKGLNYSTDVMANLVTRRARIVETEILHQKRLGGKSSLRALRDARHRFLFVMFLAIREKLRQWQVLERPRWPL